MAASRFFSLRSNLDEGVAAFATRLHVIVSGLGNITINGFDIKKLSNGLFTATITYTPGGTVYGVVGFADTTNSNVENGSSILLDNFFQANPTFTGVYIRSIPPDDVIQIPVRHLLAIYDTTPGSGNGHPFHRTLKFGVCQDNIAAGAVGTVGVLNSDRVVITTIEMRNRSTGIALAIGDEVYAYFDEIAGEYIGYAL